ncbi:hypothetical protein G352_02889 [Rhodococcus ruber BKS 20-38]|uniref:Protein kinase domain-containing protein n=1 Tax=Rhodococcus ruber BKS 20-38 TaxID=1278076 RepID=M3A1J1_9NOCA|nr:lanthionine synthetase LanC family protein [Rhodococcus ruber]EME66848.1 hypothetical protein G352_02889 [Rhodococcus ruber BKS 20-38]
MKAQADALERVALAARADASLAHWDVHDAEDAFFRVYAPPSAPPPESGTKLHVSSSVACAPDVLRACLPVLVAHEVAFKHVATLRGLSFLSTGRGGASQVGKFLTVYPATSDRGAELAALLHDVTAGFAGPRIPNEEPFAEGSLVHSRDGAFRRVWVQLPTGRIVPGRRTTDGWTEDTREVVGTDPARRPAPRVLRDRYVRMNCLFHSPKGRTDVAFVDSADGGRLVVVKEAYAHTMEETSGRDARARLAAEATCLAELDGQGVAPRLVDHWEEASGAFLVYEPVVGRTLSAVIRELAGWGQRLPADLTRAWTRSLCEAVGRVHAAGRVVADIKPTNIVVTPDGLRLIDFELSGPPTHEPVGGMGTRGYCSPQQADPRAGRSFQDDVYAIGATALAMVTGTEAAALPDPGIVAELEGERDPAAPIPRVIARCVAKDPRRRFAAVEDISRALDRPTTPPDSGTPTGAAADPTTAAVEIGERLVEAAVTDRDGYTYWLSGHHTVNWQSSRDLYTGSGGIALFLCALGEATGRTDFLEAAARCGRWLAETAPAVPRTEPMPGLYFGDCGAALLYLRLARATSNPAWHTHARSVAGAVETAQIRSPDLMTGLAGVGLLQLSLWHESGDPEALERAGDCAVELAVRRDSDRPLWAIPTGFGPLSGGRYLGYSHGSAGIGRFLAAYASVTGDERARNLCTEVADWITATAHSAVDGTGAYWNTIAGSTASSGATWCHGTAGIARFLFHAHGVTSAPAHLATALAAVRTTAAVSWLGTSQCHGLAGSIETLVDAARATVDARHLAAARSLAANLLAYRTTDGWPSDEGTPDSPDLMVGEAGVGAALLRLAFPRTSHLVEASVPSASPAGGDGRAPPGGGDIDVRGRGGRPPGGGDIDVGGRGGRPPGDS